MSISETTDIFAEEKADKKASIDNESSCQNCVEIIKRLAGWTFAELIFDYYGECVIILRNRKLWREDLSFAVSLNWLLINHPKNFNITVKIAREMEEHVKKCSTPKCVEAREMVAVARYYLDEKIIPGGVKALMAGAYWMEISNGRIILDAEEGFFSAVEDLAEPFGWFVGQNESFWIKP